MRTLLVCSLAASLASSEEGVSLLQVQARRHEVSGDYKIDTEWESPASCKKGWTAGDGNGKWEQNIGQAASPEACIKMVKENQSCKDRGANAVTYPQQPGSQSCYCEGEQTGTSHASITPNSWMSCMLKGFKEPKERTPEQEAARAERKAARKAGNAEKRAAAKALRKAERKAAKEKAREEAKAARKAEREAAKATSYKLGTDGNNLNYCQKGWTTGDGNGKWEQHIGNAETAAACVDMVKNHADCNTRNANAVTYPQQPSGSKSCYCEGEETGSGGGNPSPGSWMTCLLGSAKEAKAAAKQAAREAKAKAKEEAKAARKAEREAAKALNYKLGTDGNNLNYCQKGWTTGDGNGKWEQHIGNAETAAACIDMVKNHVDCNNRNANAVTYPQQPSGSKSCYCEGEETGSGGGSPNPGSWMTCLLGSAKEAKEAAKAAKKAAKEKAREEAKAAKEAEREAARALGYKIDTDGTNLNKCKKGWTTGDGNGRWEQHIGNAETPDACINMVKGHADCQSRGANAVTYVQQPSGSKSCYCEGDETGSGGGAPSPGSWMTCLL